jgi:hypothetical protein
VIHVSVELTVLLVHPVVQLLVLPEPMPVEQHRVIRVLLGNTTNNKDNQVVHHVVLENTMLSKDNPLAKRVPVVSTALLVPPVAY